MFKKILGVIFFVLAGLSLIGTIPNIPVGASGPVLFGWILGSIIPIVLFVLSGIFMFRFDGAKKKNYIDGLKMRGKQCRKILTFFIIYMLLFFVTCLSAVRSFVLSDNFILLCVIAVIPYVIPMVIFTFMLTTYAIPYWSCKNKVKYTDEMLNRYLSTSESFYSYSEDNSVIASDKVIFLHSIFCVIPFDMIDSIKLLKALWEQDVEFKLKNGKKVVVVSRRFNDIKTAIEYNQT